MEGSRMAGVDGAWVGKGVGDDNITLGRAWTIITPPLEMGS